MRMYFIVFFYVIRNQYRKKKLIRFELTYFLISFVSNKSISHGLQRKSFFTLQHLKEIIILLVFIRVSIYT